MWRPVAPLQRANRALRAVPRGRSQQGSACTEPSRPQAPQYAQPRRAHKREQERDGNPNAAQAQGRLPVG
eukprot:scaffold133258_cov67-Phaeocystis_antarctica.AAC.1